MRGLGNAGKHGAPTQGQPHQHRFSNNSHYRSSVGGTKVANLRLRQTHTFVGSLLRYLQSISQRLKLSHETIRQRSDLVPKQTRRASGGNSTEQA